MEEAKSLLAPMDGMTRASFRLICFEYGADGATTEMIQSLALGRAKKKMSKTFSDKDSIELTLQGFDKSRTWRYGKQKH